MIEIFDETPSFRDYSNCFAVSVCGNFRQLVVNVNEENEEKENIV